MARWRPGGVLQPYAGPRRSGARCAWDAEEAMSVRSTRKRCRENVRSDDRGRRHRGRRAPPFVGRGASGVLVTVARAGRHRTRHFFSAFGHDSPATARPCHYSFSRTRSVVRITVVANVLYSRVYIRRTGGTPANRAGRAPPAPAPRVRGLRKKKRGALLPGRGPPPRARGADLEPTSPRLQPARSAAGRRWGACPAESVMRRARHATSVVLLLLCALRGGTGGYLHQGAPRVCVRCAASQPSRRVRARRFEAA